MISLGDILIAVRSDTASAEAGIGRVVGIAQGAASSISAFFQQAFATAFGNVLAGAVENAVGGLKSIVGGALDAVGAFEMMSASVASMSAKELVQAGVAPDFMSALEQAAPLAEETLRWMEALAIQSPFGADDVSAAFQIAQTYGFVATATSDVAKAQEMGIVTAQRLSAAMLGQAAATGQNPEAMGRMALALGQMQASGKVLAGDLNQLANVGISAKQILADEFAGGSVSALQGLIEKGLVPADQAVLAIVKDMEIMSQAAGVMANSWTGIRASLADIGQFAMRDLFSPALDQLRPAALALVSFLQGDQVRGAIDSIGQGMANLVAGPAALLTGMFSNMQTIFTIVSMLAGQVSMTFSALGMVIGSALAPIFSYLAPLGGAFTAAFGPVAPMVQMVVANFATLGQAPQTMLAAFAGIFDQIAVRIRLFGEQLVSALQVAASTLSEFGPAAAQSLSGLPGIFGDILGGLASMAPAWGQGVVAAFADGLASAIGFVTNALSSIAATVSYWLTPGSPPPLLPELDKWGLGAAEAWLGGWEDARFDALESFGKMAGQILQQQVDTGQMTEPQSAQALLDVRGGMVAALEQLRRTGEVSADVLADIAQAGGPAGAQIAGLVEQYADLAQSSETVARAERELARVEAELAVVQGDVAAAQASGNAALLAQARNRQAALKQRQQERRRDQSAAKAQQKLAQEQIKQAQRILDVQQAQIDLLKKLTKAEEKSGGGGGGAAAKKQVDEVAEAQWRRNYALADTAGKLDMLKAKQSQYNETQKEYWEIQQQIDGQQKALTQEQDAAAAKAAQEAKALEAARVARMSDAEQLAYYREQLDGATEGTVEYYEMQGKVEALEEKRQTQLDRVADAQWDYQYSIADTATQIDMLKDKQAQYTQDQEEYWQLAQQIADTEEKLRKEQEAKAKAGAKGGAGKPAKPAGAAPPDPTALIRENMERQRAALEEGAQKLGEGISTSVQRGITARADAIRQGIASWRGSISQGIAEAFAPITSFAQPFIDGFLSNWQSIVGSIAGALAGGWLASLGINWAGLFAGLQAAWTGVQSAIAASGGTLPAVLGLVRSALMGLVNPFTVLVTLGAAIGTAWANNFGGIRDTTAAALASVWGTVQSVMGILVGFWETNGASILSTAETVWMQVSQIVGTVVSIIMLLVSRAFDYVTAFLQQHGDTIQLVLSTAWNIVSSLVVGALGFIQGVVAAVLSALQGDWAGAWQNIQNASASFVLGILGAVTGLLDGIAGFFGTDLATIGAQWSYIWEMLPTVVSAVAGQVWSSITGFFGGIVGWFGAQGQLLQTTFSTNWNALVTVVTAVGGRVIAAVSSWLARIMAPVLGPISFLVGEWRRLTTGLIAIASNAWAQIQPLIAAKLAQLLVTFQTWYASTIGPWVSMFTGFVGAAVAGGAGIVGAVTSWLAQVGTSIVTTVAGWLGPFGAPFLAMVGTVTGVFGVIVGTVATQLGIVSTTISGVLGAVAGFWGTTWSAISTVLSGVWAIILGVVTLNLSSIQTGIGTVLAGISTFWGGAWTAIQTIAMTVWNAIYLTVSNLVNAAANIVRTVVGGLQTYWATTWAAIQSVASTIWGAIVTLVGQQIAAVNTSVTGVMGPFQSWWGETWNAISSTFSEIWSGIVTNVTTFAGDLKTAVETAVTGAQTAITNAIAGFVGLGKDIVSGIVDGVLEAAQSLANAVVETVRNALGAGQSAADTGSPSRLFRDKLGVPIGQGPAVGVRSQIPEAEAAMVDLVSAMAGVQAPGVDGPAVGGPRGAGTGIAAAGVSGALSGVYDDFSGDDAGDGFGPGQPGGASAVALLQQLIELIRGGALVPVQVGPNTVRDDLDINDIAYRVMAEIKRRNR